MVMCNDDLIHYTLLECLALILELHLALGFSPLFVLAKSLEVVC